MADRKTVFRCQQCGYVSPKWLGRCPDCKSWESLVEEVSHKSSEKEFATGNPQNRPVALADIPTETEPRLLSGIGEWDRVLGGGLIPGSLVLLAGDPGIGKSTLLLQVLARLSQEKRVLYASGEESPQQLKVRALRLGVESPNLFVYSETSLEAVLDAVAQKPPHILVVDSIQTVHTRALDVAPGSVSQVRECASRLMRAAKETGVSIFVVGHVTKEGCHRRPPSTGASGGHGAVPGGRPDAHLPAPARRQEPVWLHQ